MFVNSSKREELYVRRYAWSNVGGNITIIPGIRHLRDTISQTMLFCGRNDYLEGVKFNLLALETYFSGKYELGSSEINPCIECMVRIFEKAIPKDKISVEVLESIRLHR